MAFQLWYYDTLASRLCHRPIYATTLLSALHGVSIKVSGGIVSCVCELCMQMLQSSRFFAIGARCAYEESNLSLSGALDSVA